MSRAGDRYRIEVLEEQIAYLLNQLKPERERETLPPPRPTPTRFERW